MTCVEALVEAGADVDRRSRVDDTHHVRSYTPLMVASLRGHAECVACLLGASADVNMQILTTRNGVSYSALHLAVVGNFEEVAQLLCSKGAKSCLDTKGRSPAALDAALERKSRAEPRVL